jgi:hypothetical protein
VASSCVVGLLLLVGRVLLVVVLGGEGVVAVGGGWGPLVGDFTGDVMLGFFDGAVAGPGLGRLLYRK